LELVFQTRLSRLQPFQLYPLLFVHGDFGVKPESHNPAGERKVSLNSADTMSDAGKWAAEVAG
jgi:hypothetical protein